MRYLLLTLLCNSALLLFSQSVFEFKDRVTLPVTPVKNQGQTGTCWSFSTTSLLESQCMKNGTGSLDLSEMFTVRNIYIEKAKNYVRRLGNARFDEGGLGHDLVRSTATYGAVPESVYPGMKADQKHHDHKRLKVALKAYLDSIIKNAPLPDNWLDSFKKMLDGQLGKIPSDFIYAGKNYTPATFAKDVLHFNPDDYIDVTSFTHEPYYKPFILQVPDNFSDGQYYNLPLDEMIQMVKDALAKGYSVLWDADVSNAGFMQKKGIALLLSDLAKYDMNKVGPDTDEAEWNAAMRQRLYENLTTQDDHLMHIYGMEKSAGGKTFLIVKNSWGKVGPFEGSINVSEAYFAINTISLVLPRAALSTVLLEKLKIGK